MGDEKFDRDYQFARNDLNDGIDRGIAGLIAGLRTAFKVLNRIRWAAPWTTGTAATRRTGRGGLA